MMKALEIIVVGIALLLAKYTVEAGTEPVNVNTADGHVKQTSSHVGGTAKPFDFRDVSVTRLPHAVTFYVEGAGSVLTTGTKNPVKIPYGGTLLGWTMMCRPSGSVTADILRAANGAGLPTTSIVGGGTKPAIASNVENKSVSFTSWTSTTLTEFDNLAINLSGITAATYVEVTLYYK
jgi:hypothetical protein